MAKLLGLGYPVGALIDRPAAQGNPAAIDFPRPMLHKPNFNFSFSGIQPSVLQYGKKCQQPIDYGHLADIAASVQEAMVEVLTRKTLRAAEAEGLQRIVVAGGVACNSGLRSRFETLSAKHHGKVFFPSPSLSGATADRLGLPANYYLETGRHADPKVKAGSSWNLASAGSSCIQPAAWS